MALAWGTVGQQAARALLAMWRAGWPSPIPLTLKGARPVVGFGTGASILAVSGAIGTRSPELVIGRLLDFAAVGLYGRAMGLAGQLRGLLTGAVAGVFYPAFARLRDQGEDLAPPYVRVVACYSAVTWPAMAFLAASSLPLVLMLYGPTWAGVAPLLVWIALSEMIFTALPLHMELPLLLGKMKRLVWLNLADTAASITMLLAFAFWGLEAAAASRVAYGVLWFGIYAGWMQRLIGFSWVALLEVHAKSLAGTIATVTPLLLAYAFWKPPAEMDFASLASVAAAGCVAWLACIFAVRHPIRHEVGEVAATLLPRPLRLRGS
jgi:O-antigen/teichoic acid export membrane protein